MPKKNPSFPLGQFKPIQPEEPPVVDLPVDESITIAGRTYTDVCIKNFELLSNIGRGTHGTVHKYKHIPSDTVIAIKQLNISTSSNDEINALIRQLSICKGTVSCPYTVPYFGAFSGEGSVWLCMELMDTSMDHLCQILHQHERRIPEDIIGMTAVSVIEALKFLHQELKVIHRDVKPANILVNRSGKIQLCDYSISGFLKNSVVSSFVGHGIYMAPERINPDPDPDKRFYGIRSDVWSLGITLIELATARHPYADKKDEIQKITAVVHGPTPTLPADEQFSDLFVKFVSSCLNKNHSDRPKYEQLRDDPFIKRYTSEGISVDVGAFVAPILDEYQAEFEQAASGW